MPLFSLHRYYIPLLPYFFNLKFQGSSHPLAVQPLSPYVDPGQNPRIHVFTCGGSYIAFQVAELETLPIKVSFDPGDQTTLQEDVDSRELLAYVYVMDMTVDDVLYGPMSCELGNDTDFSMFELCKYRED